MIVVHPKDPSTAMLKERPNLVCIWWYASDFALRFGDMLRAGKTIRESAEDLMNPKWRVNELTEYNYSRLDYREKDSDRIPLGYYYS